MNRTDETSIDLGDVSALDADAAGTIYGLLRNEDGGLCIVLLDGRQEVLEAQQRQGSLHDPVRVSRPVATQIVCTQPAIDFDARGLQVAPSGRYLLLHGTAYQDPSIVVLAVVDLHGGQPLPSSHAAGGARKKQCRLHQVDPVLFGSRPGLVLYQASWHPHSEEHLVVLTSDNRLRLYHITLNLAVAEQTFHVMPTSGLQPQRYGLAASPAALGPGGGGKPSASASTGELPASGDVVAFAFGPAVGWAMFSVLLLSADGHVFALGPLAPFGMRCPAALLERLSQEEAAAAEWLEAAFGEDAVRSPASKNRWPVLPHVVEGVSPALVGPLNLRTRQELPLPSRAVSLAVSHTLTIPPAAPSAASAPPAPASTSTAVVGYADGRLLSYAVAGPWAPAWCESAPQYMSVSGTASTAPSAVRYKCTLRGGGGGSFSTGDAAAAAAAATPRMALLDIVELPASATSHGGGGGGGRAGGGGGSDDDDEEEDGDLAGDLYGVSASAIAAARRAMTLHVQAGIAGATTAAAGGAVTVWVCFRAGGCWRMVLPWSAMLPRWLGAAAGGGAEALPMELPQPVVTCVYDVAAATQGSMTPASAATAAGSASVVGSCLMANPLLGGGLLLLSAAGSLHYFQPPGAASLLMDQQQSAATPTTAAQQQQQQQQQQAGQAAAAPSAASPRLPTASPEQRKAQVETHIKSVYGNLLAPPPDRKLPRPPAGAPAPLTVASPEGLRHLTDCIATLRGKHMAFLHGASVDLTSRAEALRSEAGKHAAAVAELTDKAAALEERQEGLEARLRRLTQLHDNLVERAGMLASLHWSLPRALSHAELATREELCGFESRAQSLGAQWETVAARARRLCEERRGSGGPGRGAAFRVASVPEAQLEKVRDAVVTQFGGLAAARAALAELERHVAATAADRTAEQLEKGLGLAAGAQDGASGAGLNLGLMGLGLRVA